MNRAEARIKSFQNSKSQISAGNDMCSKNNNFWLKMKSSADESNLALKLGRKKRK